MTATDELVRHCPRCGVKMPARAQWNPRDPLVVESYGDDSHCIQCEWESDKFGEVHWEVWP